MFGASATIVAGRLVASVAALALVAWLTTTLSRADLGQYAIVVTIANIGGLFADLGQRIYLTRQLPLVVRRWPLIRRSLLATVSVSTGLATTWFALGTTEVTHTAAGALMVGLLGVTHALVGALAGTGRVVWSGLSQQAFRPIASVLALSAVAVFAAIDTDTALLAQLAAVALVTGVTALGFARSGTPPPPSTIASEASWLATSLPLMALGGLGMLSNQLDLLLIGALDSAEGAGLYYNAAAMAYVPSYALNAANAVIMPEVSRAHSEDRLDDVHAVLGKSLRFGIAGGIPAVIGVLVAYRLGAGIGWTFPEGVPILTVLMVGQVVNVLSGSVGITLVMCGYERLVASSYAMSLVVNGAVSVALVPLIGPIGAAVGTATAMAVWNLWLVRHLRARVGVDTSVLRGALGRP